MLNGPFEPFGSMEDTEVMESLCNDTEPRPKEGPAEPNLTGLAPRHHLGDMINLNCSTNLTRVGLKFYINFRPAQTYDGTYQTLLSPNSPLNPTGNWTLLLRFVLRLNYVTPNGTLVVGCKVFRKPRKGSIEIQSKLANSKLKTMVENVVRKFTGIILRRTDSGALPLRSRDHHLLTVLLITVYMSLWMKMFA